MPFTPVTPPPRFRLSDAVFDQLEKMVVEGVLRPGMPLPSERDLAQQLGVSRPSLREALLRLETRGLTEQKSGGGYVVANTSGPLIADSLAHLMARHPKTAQDIFEMREALESLAVGLAATRATPADMAALKAALDALEQAFTLDERGPEEHDTLPELDTRFHLALADATHNVVLAHTMHAIHNLLRGSVVRSYEAVARRGTDASELVRQHREIYDAVLARDPLRAQHALQRHLTLVRDGVSG